MFETLDHINWYELETYNIDAREVPGLIRDLISPDYQTFNRADHHLTMLLFGQGSDCEALPAAMPFFIEMVEKGRGDVRHRGLMMIHKFCYSWEPYEPIHPEDWQYQAREIVAERYDLFLPLVHDPDPSIRDRALALLTIGSLFASRHVPEIFTRVQAVVAHEQVLLIQATTLELLVDFYLHNSDALTAQRAQLIAWLGELEQGAGRLLSTLASVGLLKLLEGPTSSDALQRLLAFAAPDWQSMPFTDVEREVMQQTRYEKMDTQLIVWLSALPMDRYIAAMRPFLENLSEDDARWFLRRVERFLTRVFKPRTVPNPLRTEHPQGGLSYVYKPAAERRSVDGLSPLEREALRIVLDLDALWRTQHNLLEAYSFFDPPEALRRALR